MQHEPFAHWAKGIVAFYSPMYAYNLMNTNWNEYVPKQQPEVKRHRYFFIRTYHIESVSLAYVPRAHVMPRIDMYL